MKIKSLQNAALDWSASGSLAGSGLWLARTSHPRGLTPRHFTATTLLLAALALNGCSRKAEPVAGRFLPVATVQAQVVESKSRTAMEEVVGTVRAKLRSVIEAKVSGKIEQMLVVPGQKVEAGELLVQLDAREVQAQMDQAAAVRQQAENDLKRATDLFQQKILSQSEYDSAQSKFRVADAAATEAKTLLGYTKVTAPFAGVITRKYADVGDLAAPGKPLLEMEDARDLQLETDVPEAVIGRLTLGDKLGVRVSGVSNELAGIVGEIAPSADPNSRTFLVKLDLLPTPGLRAGQFGRVAVPVGETSALRVPVTAVLQRGEMELVFVVASGRAQLRIIKTGERVGDEVELVSGVDAGEQVVVDGAARLTDGQPVEVK
ncbi:MAG TPA: efflux RND transporter periplasmic adaptor subunit [Candidatus Limnocylindrales bacterium]|nr:efflux RND transporter periplasmic adaptor subunit [Candidatus Limnocylindrales bacterium]